MNRETIDHAKIEEFVAAYALGSLERGDEAERELLEHIPGCASCRALFLDLREVCADLALAAPARPVGKELEARILGRIRGEPQPVVRSSPLRSISMRIGTVAAALALLIAGGLGAWNVSLSGRLDRAERRAALASEALAVLTHPSTHLQPLTGTGEGSLVLAFRADGRAVLVGSGIPDPGPGKLLELWFIRAANGGGGVPAAAGVVRPDGGVVLLNSEIDLVPNQYSGVAVTIESRLEPEPTSEAIYAAAIKFEERTHIDP